MIKEKGITPQKTMRDDIKKRLEEIKEIYNLPVSVGSDTHSIVFDATSNNIKSWKSYFYAYQREHDPKKERLYSFKKLAQGYRAWRIK